MDKAITQNELRKFYFLTQILEAKVLAQGKKVGRLADVLIKENGKLPEVTHLYVQRPFGHPSLLLPLDKVISMSAKEILTSITDLKMFEGEPKPENIRLKDHILDKKVLDIEDREVEVVYDVKMVMQNGKLYVSDVDLSRYGFLRRLHLKWLADLIYRPDERTNPELLSWTFVQSLPTQMGSFEGDVKLNVLKEKLSELQPQDLADILEELDREQRLAVFGELDTEHASDTLENIDPVVQRDLVASLKKDRVAQLLNEMTPAQAADVLAALASNEAEGIVQLLDQKHAKKIQSILDKQEAKIIDFATYNFIQFGPETTVAEVEVEYPKAAKGKQVTLYIYVVDNSDKLLGVVDLKDLLLANDEALLKDIMVDNIISLHPDGTLKQAHRMFRHYSFRALPIVDGQGKILGVLPREDVLWLKHKILK